MHIQPQINKNFDAAFLSQLFYFTMHLIIMSTLTLYKNPFKCFDITSVFFILMVLFSNYLFLTVSKNPGYVPKTDSDDVIILINEDTNAQKPILQKCEICNIDKPIRSKHCRTCNKCIAKFDHHCFWIGGCVGELNHRSFWLFLLVQSCVILQLLIYLIDGMGNYDYSTEINGVTVYSQEFGAYFVLFVLMGMFLLFSGGMLIFHSYLIVANLTSYEVGKKEAIPYLRKYRNRNPFDKGMFRNVWSTCFHGNQLQQWVLPEISEQPNTIWQNQYYNCC